MNIFNTRMAMYIRCLILLFICICNTVVTNASEPKLRHVFDINAICSKPLDLGRTPVGKRIVIPITGGSVSGDVTADILPGGADYQSIDTTTGRTGFDAIYSLKTTDGVIINVRNIGVSTNGNRGDYFTTTPTFEAPVESAYDWLNNRIFICRPIGFGNNEVRLRVWIVE